MDYETLRCRSVERGEANDCSVIAWAAVTGDDYDTAHYIVEDLAKRPRHSGPQWRAYLVAYKLMGYRLELVDVDSRTMVTLEREMKGKPGRYLVATSRGAHVAAIVDGRVVDWTQGRRHRVTAVWRVTRDDAGAGYDWPAAFTG